MYIIAETPRLIIREFLPTEEETYLNHFNDEEVCLHLPKRTRDERIKIFFVALANYTDNKQSGIWGMFDKTNGSFIGSCLLRPYNNEPDKLEIGYSMDKIYWGKGIGTEMAIAMVEHGFANPNIKAIIGVTTFENVASQKVLENAGLTQVDNVIREGLELACFRLERT